MARRERRLRARLGLPQGLIERGNATSAEKAESRKRRTGSVARKSGRGAPSRSGHLNKGGRP
jgi:hypothetical protein